MILSQLPEIAVLLQCDRSLERRVRYIFDTLLLAAGIAVRYVDAPPASGRWLRYGPPAAGPTAGPPGVHLLHDPAAWANVERCAAPSHASLVDGLSVVFPSATGRTGKLEFDLAANAFYFLASLAERRAPTKGSTRQLHATSEFARLDVPQDIVDRYLQWLLSRLWPEAGAEGRSALNGPGWPGDASFAIVLSHDVDFLPVRPWDNALQGLRTLARHLLRQRDAGAAWQGARTCVAALASGRDPYGCVSAIIAREQALGVSSSFQVATGRRHPSDVNYRVEDPRAARHLRSILEADFDLCLHGSYRSTENDQWYVEEADLLARCLARPRGSRQHFLSFDYDRLFRVQEAVGIEYDMSMGYPDRPGPRAGFSFPYFPYDVKRDRPFRVLEISLFAMDATLRGYMNLKAAAARPVLDALLADLRDKRGCASVVWHPIVFGGARDPGYDQLYFDLIARVNEWGGLATDGRAINRHWRERACAYPSFA